MQRIPLISGVRVSYAVSRSVKPFYAANRHNARSSSGRQLFRVRSNLDSLLHRGGAEGRARENHSQHKTHYENGKSSSLALVLSASTCLITAQDANQQPDSQSPPPSGGAPGGSGGPGRPGRRASWPGRRVSPVASTRKGATEADRRPAEANSGLGSRSEGKAWEDPDARANTAVEADAASETPGRFRWRSGWWWSRWAQLVVKVAPTRKAVRSLHPMNNRQGHDRLHTSVK